MDMQEGFYWIKSTDDRWRILEFDGREWWACGVEIPIDVDVDKELIVGPIAEPSTN